MKLGRESQKLSTTAKCQKFWEDTVDLFQWFNNIRYSGRSQDESQSHDRLWFVKIVDQTKTFPLIYKNWFSVWSKPGGQRTCKCRQSISMSQQDLWLTLHYEIQSHDRVWFEEKREMRLFYYVGRRQIVLLSTFPLIYKNWFDWQNSKR